MGGVIPELVSFFSIILIASHNEKAASFMVAAKAPTVRLLVYVSILTPPIMDYEV